MNSAGIYILCSIFHQSAQWVIHVVATNNWRFHTVTTSDAVARFFLQCLQISRCVDIIVTGSLLSQSLLMQSVRLLCWLVFWDLFIRYSRRNLMLASTPDSVKLIKPNRSFCEINSALCARTTCALGVTCIQGIEATWRYFVFEHFNVHLPAWVQNNCHVKHSIYLGSELSISYTFSEEFSIVCVEYGLCDIPSCGSSSKAGRIGFLQGYVGWFFHSCLNVLFGQSEEF